MHQTCIYLLTTFHAKQEPDLEHLPEGLLDSFVEGMLALLQQELIALSCQDCILVQQGESVLHVFALHVPAVIAQCEQSVTLSASASNLIAFSNTVNACLCPVYICSVHVGHKQAT